MSGPCLCGDTYCGSCGGSGAAAAEEAWSRLTDILSDLMHANSPADIDEIASDVAGDLVERLEPDTIDEIIKAFTVEAARE